MELGIELISTLGFPIFVAVWFMMRTEKIIALNTIALKDLTIIVKLLGEKLK